MAVDQAGRSDISSAPIPYRGVVEKLGVIGDAGVHLLAGAAIFADQIPCRFWPSSDSTMQPFVRFGNIERRIGRPKLINYALAISWAREVKFVISRGVIATITPNFTHRF